MPGRFEYSGSFKHAGEAAQFISGVIVTGSVDFNGTLSGSFIGNGSSLTGFSNQGTSDISFGGELIGSDIHLSASAEVAYDHYTFLSDKSNGWSEVDPNNYTIYQNGLILNDNCIDTNAENGVNRYLLIAVNTSSLKTRVVGTTVVK